MYDSVTIYQSYCTDRTFLQRFLVCLPPVKYILVLFSTMLLRVVTLSMLLAICTFIYFPAVSYFFTTFTAHSIVHTHNIVKRNTALDVMDRIWRNPQFKYHYVLFFFILLCVAMAMVVVALWCL